MEAKMKPHKHAELIKAWADGAEIEQRNLSIEDAAEWHEFDTFWGDETSDLKWEYRIKPEPKPNVVKAFMLVSDALDSLCFYDVTGFPREKNKQRIQVTFDGKTGEIKSTEVLK
jgi:hypothetical protein